MWTDGEGCWWAGWEHSPPRFGFDSMWTWKLPHGLDYTIDLEDGKYVPGFWDGTSAELVGKPYKTLRGAKKACGRHARRMAEAFGGVR